MVMQLLRRYADAPTQGCRLLAFEPTKNTIRSKSGVNT
jgi:hypothetical protein